MGYAYVTCRLCSNRVYDSAMHCDNCSSYYCEGHNFFTYTEHGSVCKYCSGDDVDTETLLKFVLEKHGLSEEDAIELYKKQLQIEIQQSLLEAIKESNINTDVLESAKRISIYRIPKKKKNTWGNEDIEYENKIAETDIIPISKNSDT